MAKHGTGRTEGGAKDGCADQIEQLIHECRQARARQRLHQQRLNNSRHFAQLAGGVERIRHLLGRQAARAATRVSCSWARVPEGSIILACAGCLAAHPQLGEFPAAAGLRTGLAVRTTQFTLLVDPLPDTWPTLVGSTLATDASQLVVSRYLDAGIGLEFARVAAKAASQSDAAGAGASASAPLAWFGFVDGEAKAHGDAAGGRISRPCLHFCPLKQGCAWTLEYGLVKPCSVSAPAEPRASGPRVSVLVADAAARSAVVLFECAGQSVLLLDRDRAGSWNAAAQWFRQPRAPQCPDVVVADLSGAGGDCRLDALIKVVSALKPHLLLVQGVPLELALREDEARSLEFVPRQLGILEAELAARLEANEVGTRVIVPGRQDVRVRRHGSSATRIETRVMQRAFPPRGLFEIGRAPQVFRTTNPDLAQQIELAIDKLCGAARPFLFIEGSSGSGKTQLALAIAHEVRRRLGHPSAVCQAGPLAVSTERPDGTLQERALTEYATQEDRKRSASRGMRRGLARACEPAGIEEFDLARMDHVSNLHDNDIWGREPGCLGGDDPGSPGRLGTRGGVLILNQFEKLDIAGTRKLTDLLGSWTFARFGSCRSVPVEVRLILTCNVPFAQLGNLAADMRNRLQSHRLVIPGLEDLPEDLRQGELEAFLVAWCESHCACLSEAAMAMVLQVDLSAGGFRSLGDLLEQALAFERASYGAPASSWDSPSAAGLPAVLWISESSLRCAVRHGGLRWRTAASRERRELPELLVLKIAIWMSHGCALKPSYLSLRAGQGKTHRQFSSMLAQFARSFSSVEDAWQYLAGPGALEVLGRSSGLRDFVQGLGVASDPSALETVLSADPWAGWQDARMADLRSRLQPGTTRCEQLRRAFARRLGRLRA